MSSSIRMDGSHPGILCNNLNLWIYCTLSLFRPAPLSGHTHTHTHTHTHIHTQTHTHWVAAMSILDVNSGWTTLLTLSSSSDNMFLLDVACWTMEWPCSIICTAAYLKYNNTARCPGRFKQPSDEFYPHWIAKRGGEHNYMAWLTASQAARRRM